MGPLEGTPLALGADGGTGANWVLTSGIRREQVQSDPHSLWVCVVPSILATFRVALKNPQ